MMLTPKDKRAVLSALGVASVGLRTANDLCAVPEPCPVCAERLDMIAEYDSLAARMRGES